MRAVVAAAAAGVLLAGGCAGTPAALKPMAVSAPGAKGYLTEALIASLAESAPPSPVQGSSTDVADRARSAAFRSLEDSDRWLLATAHAELRPPLALQHFDCVLGTRLAEAETPRLDQLMERLFEDANATAERVKTHAFRARPVGDEAERRACQRVSTAGRNSASYPSGSASVAAVYGEAFAALAPDRAEPVRSIAHHVALSRLVCAMHYPTDVEVGEQIGRAVFDAARHTPGFDADLAAARAELVAAQSSGLTNPSCEAERVALATPLP